MNQPVSPTRRRRPRWAVMAAGAVGVVVVVLVVVLAVSKPDHDTADSPIVGEAAPTLAGKRLDVQTGRTAAASFRLASPPGKWVVVNFFASWCVPCQGEAPELAKWADADEQAGDAELVQVVFGDTPSESAKFLRANGGATWPVVVGDTANQLALDWGVSKVPETFIIAPDGTVVLKTIDQVTQAWLDKQLSEAEGATS